jgi:hypothetical protein
MRIMERNKKTIWFCLYDHTEPIVDEYGNETSGEAVVYRSAEEFRANVSAASGAAQLEQFGNLAGYDKVIVTDDTDCPINENTVLFIDKEPEYDEDGKPLYDYVVKRVAKSRNFTSIAVAKVSVS